MIFDPATPPALERFGYTPRQAQFIGLIARHGGYFLRRQYVTFTGRAHGLAAVRFLAQVVARGHVRALPYGRQGHVFHVYARPLYAALGEEHNRNRRVVEWDAVTRKLMTVDFVLARSKATFFATEQEKSTLLTEWRIEQHVWPARWYESRRPNGPKTKRYFLDKMPWYREPDDPRLWFAYVDSESTLAGFETFLTQYRDLLTVMSSGVTYVAPTTWRGAIQSVFDRVLEQAPPSVFTLPTFLSHCRLRRDVEGEQFAHLRVADLHQFGRLRSRFTGAVDDLYLRWLEAGEAAIQGTDLARVAPLPCVLNLHALGRRYVPFGRIANKVNDESQVT